MTEERKIYMEKKDIVHTSKEILAAFEDNTAIVFGLGDNKKPLDRSNLMGGIWKINPEAIIQEVDLCVFSVESTAQRRQLLIIDKGGNSTTGNQILKLMHGSGVVPCCYVSYKDRKHGIKKCITQMFDHKIRAIKKMNLLIDGSDLLVTVRYLSEEDQTKKENSEA